MVRGITPDVCHDRLIDNDCPPTILDLVDSLVRHTLPGRVEQLAPQYGRPPQLGSVRQMEHIVEPVVEFLGRLAAEQADATRNRRLSAGLRYARFPFRKTIAEFDFEFQPTVDRRLVNDLATLRFMATGRPVLFLGQRPAAAKPTSPSRSPPWPSKPATGATSLTPRRWSRTSPKPAAKATSRPS